MAIAQYHIPPYQAIKESLRVVRALTISDLYSFPSSAPGTGVVAHDERKSAPGVTFVTRYAGDLYAPALIDQRGALLHQWHLPFSSVRQNAPYLAYQANDEKIMTIGAHLFPNGDVMMTYQGGNHPDGSGLVTSVRR